MKIILATLFSLATLAYGYPEADCFVAPNGNDEWSGSRKAPFKTLARAQEFARNRCCKEEKPTTIILRKGTYTVSSAWEFTPADSGRDGIPVTWKAYPGEKPVISGGRVLTGWKENADGLWELQIPEVAEGKWFFHQLFANGKRLLRCREPDQTEEDGWYFRSAGPLVPRPARRSKEWGNPECRIGFFFNEGDLQNWDDADNGMAVVFQSWTASVHWIKSIDTEKKTLRFTAGSAWPMGYWEKNQRYYIENVRAAIDEPGEWYLNRKTGLCLYKPRKGEKLKKFAPIAPVAEQLLKFVGDADAGLPVANINFEGISFQHSIFPLPLDKRQDGQAAISLTGALHLQGAANCQFKDIEIAHVGTYGFWFDKGTRNCTLIRSEIHDLGAGGVKIGGTRSEPNPATACRENLVENCFIHDGGHIAKAGIGVWIGRSSYHTVVRNEISDFDYSGGSIGWSWGYAPSSANHNNFSYNHIHHIGNGVLSDMGGIYCLGKSPGTVLRGNIMHNINSYAYGGWGLYTDEGSSDILMEKNIVYRTKSGGFHQHYGEDNILRHNILAFAREGQVIRSREESHNSFFFDHNIVIFDNGRPLGKNYTNQNYVLDHNLYWDVSGQPFTFAGYDFEQWREEGNDKNSRIADPRFKNAEKGDFRLKRNSPAILMDIKPLQDFSKVGLYGPRWWTKKPKKIKKHRPIDPTMKPASAPPKLRRNTNKIEATFEELAVGDKFPLVSTSGENVDGGTSIRIAANPAGTGKVLKFQETAGIEPEWQPHLSCNGIKWANRRVKASFDVMMTPNAEFWHEWRGPGGPYTVGPELRFKDGKLYSQKKELCTIPDNQWVHIDVAFAVSAETPKTFDLTVTLPGDLGKTFNGLPFVNQKFTSINNVVWVSNGTKKACFYVDNLNYQRLPLATKK